MKILAIDLGKFKSVACQFNTETHEAEFETIVTHRWAIQQLLEHSRPDRVVIETCSISGWVHDLCEELGYAIEVANPSQDAWKWKHVKRKTDKDDAFKLGRLSALGEISAVYVPAAETRQYRSLVKYRKTLVRTANRIQNRIRALFDHQGVTIPSGDKAWTIQGIATLSQSRKVLTECDLAELWKGELDLELKALDAVWEQLHQIETKLKELAQQDAQIQLLETIPGVGRKTAEVIVTCLDTPTRFRNAREVSAYAGLVPTQRQSGQTNRFGKITRRGSRLLRAALVEAAWVMLRYNHWAAQTYERIRGGQKTRKKTAIIAVARKLLVRCWAMLRDGQPWNEAHQPKLAQAS